MLGPLREEVNGVETRANVRKVERAGPGWCALAALARAGAGGKNEDYCDLRYGDQLISLMLRNVPLNAIF